jgi:hypothetical protein
VHAAIGFCIALVLTNAAHPSAPLDQMRASRLAGAGWTLDLAPGWKLVPAAKSSSFTVKKE